uniref:Uncharacterized protein n=1 Tax=Meloidogyne enterolobii TaxID=390850 RepID=A0A6V7WV18_MELEN|nr:unnamed protein product [Meloidogyne enterolobii]
MLKFPFQVNKGCGNCPSKTCITCYKHKCNDGNDLPYYCLDYDGKSVIECKKSDCYIDKCISRNGDSDGMFSCTITLYI